MILLHPRVLDQRTNGYLSRWTAELTREVDFSARVATAKRRFASRNRKSNKTFQRVKVALREMSNEQWRCVYCEDNFADEVEHIRPKDIYPEQCFQWENYVYACGPCNGPKNNHFAVVDNLGAEHTVTPAHGARGPRIPPVPGVPLMIDPRVEDPLRLLALDLMSGGFAPLPGLSALDRRRAEWTRDTLGLNKRRLPKARLKAKSAFASMLKDYTTERDRGRTAAALAKKVDIIRFDHPTVLREMWRQRAASAELTALFAGVPEVHAWW